MKDIIAMLEEQRDAGRACGEKQHAARQARDKLIVHAGIACSTVVSLALVAIMVFPPRASALGTLWASPKGDFAVSLPEGWDRIAPPSGLQNAMMAIAASPSEPFRACAVTGEWRPVPSRASQERGNAATAQVDAEQMMAAFPVLGRQVISYSNDLRSGVRVSSVVFEYQQPPTNQAMRSYGHQFIVIRNNEFRFYTINCGVQLPATGDELALVQRFMDSLTFNSDQPP